MSVEEKLVAASGGIIHVAGGYLFGSSFELCIKGEKKYFEVRDSLGEFCGTFPVLAIYRADLDEDKYLQLFLR